METFLEERNWKRLVNESQFCETIIDLLKNSRFKGLSDESYPRNTKINNEIIDAMTQADCQSLLSRSLKSIFRSIRKLNETKTATSAITPSQAQQDGTGSDDSESKSKEVEKQVTVVSQHGFGGAFKTYIYDQVYSENVKPNVNSFLTLFIFELSIFEFIKREIIENSKSKDDQAKKLLSKFVQTCADKQLIDTCMIDEYGQSIYHIISMFDEPEILDFVTSLDNDVNKYTDSFGKVEPINVFLFFVLFFRVFFFFFFFFCGGGFLCVFCCSF